MAASKKLIVIIGGTGMVGGSVARSLYDNPEYHVRLTTRDLTTDKAKRCNNDGFDIVKADSWNKDELDAVFNGAWGVFLNTDSDDPNFKSEIGPPESAMGKIVIDAAIRQGVHHFVYSGLPRSAELTNSEVQILSFDNKAAISDYGRKAGFKSFTEVNIGWAMDIFWMETYGRAFGGFATIPDKDGFLTLKIFPMSNNPERIPWTSVKDDYGDAVHGVFLDPQQWDGKIVWAISDITSFQNVVDSYNQYTGTKTARFVPEHQPLKAATPGKTKEVNGLRNYCHYMKGRYCNGQTTDDNLLKVARNLKALASEARGRSERDAQLQTVDGFIRMYCPVKPTIQS
jgi:hypothetical protein